MKKIKRFLLSMALVLLGAVIAGGAVYAYNEWKGSNHTTAINANLELLENEDLSNQEYLDIINSLYTEIASRDKIVKEKDEYIKELLTQVNELKEINKHQAGLIEGRDKAIKELQDQVLERDKIIEELHVIINQAELENEQALKDIQAIDIRLQKIIDKRNLKE